MPRFHRKGAVQTALVPPATVLEISHAAELPCLSGSIQAKDATTEEVLSLTASAGHRVPGQQSGSNAFGSWRVWDFGCFPLSLSLSLFVSLFL